MSPDVRDFVLDCPVCQMEKGSNVKTGGELQPLEIPARKWNHVAIDFITGMPVCQGKDTILTVVDKTTNFDRAKRRAKYSFSSFREQSPNWRSVQSRHYAGIEDRDTV